MDAINKIMQTPSPARHEPNHTTQLVHTSHTSSHPMQCEHHQSCSRNRKPVFVVGFIFMLGLYVVALLLHIKLFKYKCLTALVLRKLAEDKMLIPKFPPFCLQQPDSAPYRGEKSQRNFKAKFNSSFQNVKLWAGNFIHFNIFQF